MRGLLAIVAGSHGIAHLAGTSDLFARAADGRSAELLGGAWTASDPTLLRAYGIAWAIVAVAYLAVAYAIWVQARRWPWMLAAVTLASLALVVVALWAAVAGLVIDAGLLAVAAWLIAKPRSLSR